MSNTPNKFVLFLKKNGIYIVLALCIVAIGLSVALSIVNKGNELREGKGQVEDEIPTENIEPENTEPTGTGDAEPSDIEPVTKVITFSMPVLNTTGVNDYSDSMVFNQTLKRYSSHKAIDFYAEDGSSVYAVYDGKVESVDNTLLNGITITIDHGDGLKSVYNSVKDADKVYIGKVVKMGDIIGEVSTTNRTEYKDGAHLHFEVIENGQIVDPSKYLTINEK